MPGELTVLEQQLQPLAPRLAQALGNTMPVERLIRTVIVSVERLPKLLECDRQSLFNSAMSAAVLGLEVDGVTGQAYLIPFKGKAQLVIGYKGYNTLAARSGITVQGEVVREGDEFDFELGDKGYVRHKPKLGNKGRIIAAWATGAANGRPPLISVLSIDEILAIKNKSPGAARPDSPWNDTAIGFPAMAAKSAKRRLARAMPLNVMHLAARMDEAVDEQGAPAWISPDKGLVIDGEIISPQQQREQSPTPTAQQLISPQASTADRPAADQAGVVSNPKGGGAGKVPTAAEYVERWGIIINGAMDAPQLTKEWNDQKAARNLIDWPEGVFEQLKVRVQTAIENLKAAP